MVDDEGRRVGASHRGVSRVTRDGGGEWSGAMTIDSLTEQSTRQSLRWTSAASLTHSLSSCASLHPCSRVKSNANTRGTKGMQRDADQRVTDARHAM
jgi:hypothetical protein